MNPATALTETGAAMPDLSPVYSLLAAVFPFSCMEARFMQQAMAGLLLLAPLCAAMGVSIVNFRMAFFSDAISHSAFTGVALGLILGVSAQASMMVFGVIVGLLIVTVGRRSSLSKDTVIGVFFSGVIAFGLAVVSRDRQAARDITRFLYGDILTTSDGQILCLALLFAVLSVFVALGYNRMLLMGINQSVAMAHRVKVRLYQYLFAGLVSVVVIFAVWAVGVFLVTALLIVPAATGRNLARSAGGMFWWAVLVSVLSAVSGLIISAQPWAGTATGATVVLVSCVFFLLSLLPGIFAGKNVR